jgi:hypothetical protein
MSKRRSIRKNDWIRVKDDKSLDRVDQAFREDKIKTDTKATGDWVVNSMLSLKPMEFYYGFDDKGFLLISREEGHWGDYDSGRLSNVLVGLTERGGFLIR